MSATPRDKRPPQSKSRSRQVFNELKADVIDETWLYLLITAKERDISKSEAGRLISEKPGVEWLAKIFIYPLTQYTDLLCSSELFVNEVFLKAIKFVQLLKQVTES